MRILIDINVVLDVLLERSQWVEEAAGLLAAAERTRVNAYVAGHKITTAHYVVSRSRDKKVAATALTDLLRILEVVPVEKADFTQALVLGFSDFEDAVQVACAMKIGAEYLVTRNDKDFKGSPVPVLPAGAVLALL